MCAETGVVTRRKRPIRITRRTIPMSPVNAEARSSGIIPRMIVLLAACSRV